MNNKKIFGLTAILVVFGILISSYAYASSKITVNSARLNGKDFAENRRNFITDTNNLDIIVSLTALTNLNGVHVQAILTDIQTGNTLSDSTAPFNLLNGQGSLAALSLRLIDSLKREKDFSLMIKIFDGNGGVLEQKTYGIKFTGGKKGKGILDVSLDRVRINGQILASLQTNFIERSNDFDVLVGFTTLEDLNNAHVEAILRDLRTGTVVADATSNFNLPADTSSSSLLRLSLLDGQKNSDSFELTIKIIDTDGNSIQQVYGLRRKGGISSSTGASSLDVSINRVLVNSQVVATSQTNFIDRSNDFNVAVEFTVLEKLRNGHVEAILKDLITGDSVADATSTFNLTSGSSSSSSLKLGLLDKLKQSNSFELTIKIIDDDGNVIQKVYGITMREKAVVLSGTTTFRALDISLDSVELEDKTLAENENNFIIIKENINKLRTKVRLTSLENVKNAHVDAVLTFGNGNVVADSTTTFDANNGARLTKELELPIISPFEQNNFRLKIKIVDADGNVEEKQYGLTLSQKKFPFVISSIVLSPEDNVEAGKDIIATLRFKNSGIIPLEGISAKVSIPELGISSTKFVDQIKNSNLPEVREDFILKVLDNVQTGAYTIRSEIASQFGGESEVKEIPVFVLGKSDQSQQIVNNKLIITVPILKQDIATDGSEVIYPITLKNEGPVASAYTILLDGANWAKLRLDDSNTFVFNPKQSKTINAYASSKGNAFGEQIFVVTIKSNDQVLKQIPLKGNVVSVTKSASSLMNIIGITLIGFFVLLVIVGLFFVVKRFIGGKDISEEIPDEAEGEAYY